MPHSLTWVIGAIVVGVVCAWAMPNPTWQKRAIVLALTSGIALAVYAVGENFCMDLCSVTESPLP